MEKKTIGVKTLTSNKGSWSRFLYVLVHANLPWIWIALVIGVSLGASKLQLVFPQYTSKLLNGDITGHLIKLTIITSIALILVTFLNNFCQRVGEVAISRNLRLVVWGRILKTKPSGFGEAQPGEMISRVTTDTSVIGNFLVNFLLIMISYVYYICSSVSYLASINKGLLMWMLACIPFTVIATIIWGRINFNVQVKVYEKISKLTHYLSDRVTKIPLIKAYGTENKEIENGRVPIEEMYSANVKSAQVSCVGNIVTTIIMSVIPSIILMVIGADMINKGQLNFGNWTIFFMYSAQMTSNILTVISEWADIKGTQGAIMRVSGIMINPSEFNDTYPDKSGLEGNIEIRDLNFSYENKKVFHDLNLVIKEGQKTAIIGESGCGKTTLLKLLERFYEVEDGSVFFNGRDINTYDLVESRRSISYISQDAPMFSGTIREAVSYGVGRTLTDEEIKQALDASCALDFVQAMPEGLDSQVGEEGSKLSGGQRQKLAMTRGILRNSRYVIFDESTSSMDAHSAMETQRAIDRFTKGRTCIMVSHNMSMIRDADIIIALKNGKVEAEGAPEEMLKISQVYRSFCGEEGVC